MPTTSVRVSVRRTFMRPVRAPTIDVTVSDTSTATRIAQVSTPTGTERVITSGMAAPRAYATADPTPARTTSARYLTSRMPCEVGRLLLGGAEMGLALSGLLGPLRAAGVHHPRDGRRGGCGDQRRVAGSRPCEPLEDAGGGDDPVVSDQAPGPERVRVGHCRAHPSEPTGASAAGHSRLECRRGCRISVTPSR